MFTQVADDKLHKMKMSQPEIQRFREKASAHESTWGLMAPEDRLLLIHKQHAKHTQVGPTLGAVHHSFQRSGREM